jgi:anti-anti-sigma factor
MAAESAALHIERVATGQARTALFRLAGDLDLSTVDELRASVGPACTAGDEVLLDLSELKFCDSTGVGAMVWLHRHATGAGGRLVLCAPRRHVREVLRISGVDRAIPVVGRSALPPRSDAEATRPGPEPRG